MSYKRYLSQTIHIVKIAVTTFCVGHCTFEYLGDFILCKGPSMEPTLTEGNIIYLDRIFYYFTGIKRLDIVVSRSVSQPNTNVCKRVEAVAGDVVWNGYKFIEIPYGQVFLVGDNLKNSTDSRAYGPVPLSLIKGRVLARLWPLKEFEIFYRST